MKIDPDYGEVYFNYGNLLSDIGEFEAAAARYIHRQRVHKKNLNYVIFLLIQHSFEKAIQYPQMYAKTLNNLATMYFRLSQFQLTCLHKSKVVRVIVLCFAPYIGNWKQAEERFKESLELTPNQATTYNNLGKESLYNETGIHYHVH